MLGEHPVLKSIFTLAALFAAGTAMTAVDQAVNPPDLGAQFLTAQGYTNVKGGAPDYLANGCLRHDFARDYTATNPATGRTEPHAVCMGSGVFGPYKPWFGA